MPLYDELTARIRMRVLTINGKPNYNWHSLDKYTDTTKSDKAIINGMLRRFLAKPYANEAQVLQFYDNKTNVLIEEVKP